MARFALVFSGVWSLLVIAWVACNFVYFHYLRSLIGTKSKLSATGESRFLELMRVNDVGGWDVVFDVNLLLGEIIGTALFPSLTCLVLAAVFDRVRGRKSWQGSEGTPSRIGTHTGFSVAFGGAWAFAVVGWATYKYYHLQAFIDKKRKLFDSDESRFVEVLTRDVGGFRQIYDVNLVPLEIATTVILPLTVCLALGVVADRLFVRK